MLSQALQQKLQEFRPLDQNAELLIEVGFELSERLYVSGPHLILAALRADSPDSLRAALYASQRARDMQGLYASLQRNNFAAALKSWSDLPSDRSAGEVMTFGLSNALKEARADAHRNAISVPHLLNSIVMHDPDVLTVIAALGPGHRQSSTLPWLPGLPGNSFHPTIGLLYAPVRCEATSSRRYRARHRVQIDKVLRELSERHEDQVLLARGLYGSPLGRLANVLADTLIDPSGTLLSEPLTNYKHVFRQDVAKLHAASMDDGNGAVVELQYTLSHAHIWQAILILTRGELLVSDNVQLTAVNNHILGALLRTGNVPVIITFEESSEADLEQERVLPLVNYREVIMEGYTRDNAVSALPSYYGSSWKSANVSVRPDALDCIFELEPAIYASVGGHAKRKVLPYSAGELIQETIRSVQKEVQSPGHIHALALTAKQHAEHLQHERGEGRKLFSYMDALERFLRQNGDMPNLIAAAKLIKTQWEPRCELILDLPARMQRLADYPTVEQTQNSELIISQALVTAQFLSDGAYHLRLVQAFKNSVLSTEPQLLTKIISGME